MRRAGPLVAWILMTWISGDALAAVEDYAFVEPGPCITGQPALDSDWRSANALFAAGSFADAREIFLRCAVACPNDPAPRFMAALSAWGLGDRPQAIRWLVQAQRATQHHAAAFALGALYADDTTDAVPIGWVQRGLALAPEAERAYWISRPEFERFWTQGQPAWIDLLREYGLPHDYAVIRAAATRPERQPPPASSEKSSSVRLHLSPFDPTLGPTDRSIEMRKQVVERMIDRIRSPAEIPALPEEDINLAPGPEEP